MGLPISDLLVMTWKSISRDLVRSGLTTLGVFMGVAAVSATLNIQTITSTQIAMKLAERDKPYVVPYLSSEAEFSPPVLGEADKQALKQAIPVIRSISAISDVYSIQSVQFEDRQVKQLRVQSVSLNYLETTGRRILQGRFFDRADLDQYRPVVIVDEKLATALFQGQNPIRQEIYASGTRLMVVGVTETKSDGSDFKTQGTLWIVESFATMLQGSFRFNVLQISPYKLNDIKELKDKVEKVLLQRYPQATIYLNDNTADIVKEKEAQEMASRALTVVGLIALAIGGVGIANITIASVMERTKEIGILRALGATQFEIMLQFILEAVLLSLVGGIAAIVIVHGLTDVVTTVVLQAPYTFSVNNAVIATGSALLVGVGSSFLPALRATKIDIVKALRSE